MEPTPPDTLVTAPAATDRRQRLFVCLDGTWNTRDDCTNVFHLFNMIRTGDVDANWRQLKYYDQGVGTGVLDGAEQRVARFSVHWIPAWGTPQNRTDVKQSVKVSKESIGVSPALDQVLKTGLANIKKIWNFDAPFTAYTFAGEQAEMPRYEAYTGEANRLGEYRFDKDGRSTLAVREGPQAQVTFYHEYGHLIDHKMLGTGMYSASEINKVPAMKEMMAFLNKTQSSIKLEKLRKGERSKKRLEHIAYLQDPSEQFARAFEFATAELLGETPFYADGWQEYVDFTSGEIRAIIAHVNTILDHLRRTPYARSQTSDGQGVSNRLTGLTGPGGSGLLASAALRPDRGAGNAQRPGPAVRGEVAAPLASPTRSTVTPAQDTAFLAAVAAGDLTTAQRLIAALLAQIPFRLTDLWLSKLSKPMVTLRTHWPVALFHVALAGLLWKYWPPCGALGAVFRGSGGLLLAVVLFFYFQNSLRWVGHPLATARLGNILRLQKCFTAGALKARLCAWRDTLVRDALPEDPPKYAKAEPPAAAAMRLNSILKETLWRDILGFVPLYTVFFLVALQLGKACNCACWDLLAVGLPLATAALDQVENGIHLLFSHHFAKGGQPRFAKLLATVAAVATSLKTVGFVSCLGLSLWLMSTQLWEQKSGSGIAGGLALILGALLALSFLVGVISRIKESLVPTKQRVRMLIREQPTPHDVTKRTKLA